MDEHKLNIFKRLCIKTLNAEISCNKNFTEQLYPIYIKLPDFIVKDGDFSTEITDMYIELILDIGTMKIVSLKGRRSSFTVVQVTKGFSHPYLECFANNNATSLNNFTLFCLGNSNLTYNYNNLIRVKDCSNTDFTSIVQGFFINFKTYLERVSSAANPYMRVSYLSSGSNSHQSLENVSFMPLHISEQTTKDILEVILKNAVNLNLRFNKNNEVFITFKDNLDEILENLSEIPIYKEKVEKFLIYYCKEIDKYSKTLENNNNYIQKVEDAKARIASSNSVNNFYFKGKKVENRLLEDNTIETEKLKWEKVVNPKALNWVKLILEDALNENLYLLAIQNKIKVKHTNYEEN
jgi:hypothetical protein